VISNFLTKYSYERLVYYMNQTNPKRILDIGVGTGSPLKHIWNMLPPKCEVLGVDID
jgi:ubiquinone/menaquinone biosynthesis C-methylase UbiE